MGLPGGGRRRQAPSLDAAQSLDQCASKMGIGRIQSCNGISQVSLTNVPLHVQRPAAGKVGLLPQFQRAVVVRSDVPVPAVTTQL